MPTFKTRLAALEQAEQRGPHFPQITPALMLSYGTPEEIAAWEAAGRPEITKAEWDSTINQVYVVLVPGEDGQLIAPNGRVWADDEDGLIDLDKKAGAKHCLDLSNGRVSDLQSTR